MENRTNRSVWFCDDRREPAFLQTLLVEQKLAFGEVLSRFFLKIKHDNREKKMNKLESFKELIERSQNEKRGLTIYLNGQTVVGIVTEIIGDQAIEMHSRQYHKAVVLLDAVVAMTVS
jgi:hypothetical protein